MTRMTPKAAAARERDRILAYLRYCIDECYIDYVTLFDEIARQEHWDRWDELDEDGQQPLGTKDPYD